MDISAFDYDLPPSLIAQHPPAVRGDSRLLHVQRTGHFVDSHIRQLPALLRAGDLLVFNDTRVLPARLFGHKSTGGKVEIMLERLVDDDRAWVQIRATKSPKPGGIIHLHGMPARVQERHEDLFLLSCPALRALFLEHGRIPLPPYIDRPDDAQDRERYQTVYAAREGAVAAPTAGLHFDKQLLQDLEHIGVETAFVTLHVGMGTFQPVRVRDIRDHRMHREIAMISDDSLRRIEEAGRQQRRVVAVGTTTVRCLESLPEGMGGGGRFETDLFIYPGYKFRRVDALLTNFHMPKSSLLMMVCAFAGPDLVMQAYAHAIKARYRFFSYGDAMFIE